ncbi:MAG TPA: SDR family oxidoreductase [Tepidisphaeraceae bacterium]|nr:SDR family oxidoreductase [Tepidisphaeraceae bacterium]
MADSVALITGAGRGIGRATAIELSSLGYKLALLARGEAELSETARVANGALCVPADVTDPIAVELAVRKTVETYGGLDAIVHCAGVAPVRGIDQMSVEEWREVIETNLSSAFYLCRAAWPTFRQQNRGVVVLLSSESSRDPFDGFAAYGAAKAGLNLFGRSAAREGQQIGVRVHVIAPAAVETGMFRQILSREQYPTENTLQPADVARVIVQCVQGDLKYSSGEVIYMHKTM